MATYLDTLSEFTTKAHVRMSELGLEAAVIINNQGMPWSQIQAINWYNILLTGANDTTLPGLTDDIRLELLTVLVDNARLNEIPIVFGVNGLVQTISGTVISEVAWGSITGNINSQADLIAKFNTYLPLAGGIMTGGIDFNGDGLGIDVFNEGDTLNIGASAGVVQFGLDGEVRLNVITQGAWNGSVIGVTYGGTGLNSLTGQAGKALVVNGGATGFTFATIPSTAGFLPLSGGTMTGQIEFEDTFGIDTVSGGGTLSIGGNATIVQFNSDIEAGNINQGTWLGSNIALSKGGTGQSLSDPGFNAVMVWDNTTNTIRLAELQASLAYSSLTNRLGVAGTLSNITITGSSTWQGDVIGVVYGGTGLNAIGAPNQYLKVNSGGTALEYATLTALVNPMTTAGDMIYGGASGTPTRLAANSSSTNRFLRSVSSGNPSWQTLVAADIPNIAVSQVTGLTTALANKLGTTLDSGKIFVGNGAGAAAPVFMSGDATLSNTGALTIVNATVSFAKIQNITSGNLVGRWSAGSGSLQEITLGSGLALSGTGVLTATGGGGGGTPGGVTGDLQWNNAGSFGGVSSLTTDGTTINANAANFFLVDNNAAPVNTINFDINNVTAARIWAFPDASSTFVGTGISQTLTNKTISGDDNTLTNIGNASLVNSAVTINGGTISLGGSGTITAVNPNALTIGTGLSGTSYNGSAAVTIAIDSTVATLSGSQTLTNKTLTSPIINVGSDATGDIYFRSAGGAFTRLPIGTTGQVLTVASGIPSWAAGGGGFSALSAITAATGANTITGNGNLAQEWQWNTLAGTTAFRLSSNSTAAASNLQTLFSVGLSGANATASQTTTATSITNTHTGTSSTNIALSLTASGGTTNYGLLVTAGLVGIGLTNPTGLLHLSGATASVPHLILAATSGITPSLATNGAMWYNTASSNSTLNLYKDSGYTRFITLDRNPDFATGSASGVIIADTAGTLTKSGDLTALGIFATSTSVTVANTTTATSLVGTVVGSTTLPANFFGVGKVVKVYASGTFGTTTSSQTVNVVVSIGGVTVATIPITHTASLTGRFWQIECTITCRATGASGNVRATGLSIYDTGNQTANSGYSASATSGAINTTGTLAIGVQAQWGTADPSNTITADQVYAEYIN